MWRASVLALVACAGCNQIFGLSKADLVDSPVVIGGECGSGSNACNAPMLCDTATNECVACVIGTNTDNCTGTAPTCGSDDVCHACVAHSDCASDVCNPDGSCAAAADVSYVAPGGVDPVQGTDEPCSQAQPCATIAGALTSAEIKPTIKVRGSITSSTVFAPGSTFTVIGDDDAQLHSSTGTGTITVQGDAKITLRDLQITSAPQAGILENDMDGLSSATITVIHCTIADNGGLGIKVVSSNATTKLVVAQSIIRANDKGGIETDGAFDIVGNVFFGNGGSTSSVGGIYVNAGVANASNRLDFNTFANNVINVGAPAIFCATTVTPSNNIVAFNTFTTGAGQVSNTCTYAFTLEWPDAAPPGATNMMKDPMFENANQGKLELMTGSPAQSAADPHADLTGLAAEDPNGKPRVSPADLGAFAHLDSGSGS